MCIGIPFMFFPLYLFQPDDSSPHRKKVGENIVWNNVSIVYKYINFIYLNNCVRHGK